jgi:hypothetical protein
MRRYIARNGRQQWEVLSLAEWAEGVVPSPKGDIPVK